MKASYITDSIRGYIIAGECGADTASLSAMRGEITAALLAADPELSNTAATFRFHKLVSEMRDNDEISPETLARIAPQRVSVTDKRGSVWHLVSADNKPVAAGEHITDTGLDFTIAATPDASCDFNTGEPVRIAVTYRGAERVAWIKAEMLVTGWHWQAGRA